MMERIESGGVILDRVGVDDLELLRGWRNAPTVNQFLVFKDYISVESQKAWFERINNNFNFYFVVRFDGRPVGYTELKGIDYASCTAEYGIVIAEEAYRDTPIPIKVALMMFRFAADRLGIKKIHAVVLKSNQRALRFNQHLGYRILSECDDIVRIGLDLYETESHRAKLWKFFERRF